MPSRAQHEMDSGDSTPDPKKTTTTPSPNGKGKDSYQPYHMEYSLMAEYRLLNDQGIPGVYVMPSANSHLVWFGVIFIHGGVYEGGVFKFTLFIPENYPDSDCPRVVFDVPVFHPLIDPTSGELCCRRAFPKWRRNVNHIWHVILYARRVFYKVDTKPNPLHPEAAVLVESKNEELFKWKVEQSLQACRDRLYDKPKIEDDHAIRFSELDDATYAECKQAIAQSQRATPETARSKGAPLNGLSWMSSGSVHIFQAGESDTDNY